MIRDAIEAAGVFTIQDLCTLGPDAEAAAPSLGLSKHFFEDFSRMFATAKERAAEDDEEKVSQMVDILNAEGDIIMRRARSDVHQNGFWHRAVNVWVVCPSTTRVLLGLRALSKSNDPHRWTCVCGRVPSGEVSMDTAVVRLAAEFQISAVPDQQLFLVFSMKCPRNIDRGVFAGQQDSVLIDVYLAILDEEMPLEALHLDVRSKQAAKYASVAEIARAYEVKDEAYVIPPNEEYINKLVYHLRRTCKTGGQL